MAGLDILLINPAGYRGTPRRGPYELAQFQERLANAGLATELLDLQALVGAGDLPFPTGHLEGVDALLAARPARVCLVTLRTTAGPWATEAARLAKRHQPACTVLAYAPRIESRVRRQIQRDDAIDLLMLADEEPDVVGIAQLILQAGARGAAQHPQVAARDTAARAPARMTGATAPYRIGPPWISPDRTIAALHVGRGCPDRCTFCAAHLGAGGAPRYADAGALVDAAQCAWNELAPGRLFVMLETENLTSNRTLVEDIDALRRGRHHDFLWGAYGRIDHMDATMRALLQRGGCRFLFFGIEAARPHLLKILGKNYDPALVLPALLALRDAGIATQSSFIFGIPGETMDDFHATAMLMADVAWAGGFVDWTPLRIEAGSAMERMTAARPLRLLPHSELFADLAEAGLHPEAIDPDCGYRMYGIDTETLDLDLACVLARKWRNFLMRAPLTAYLVHYGIGLGIADIFAVFAHDTSHVAMEDPLQPAALWRDCDAGIAAFASAFYASELALTGAGGDAGHAGLLAALYADLRRRPALIPAVYRLAWWRRAPRD